IAAACILGSFPKDTLLPVLSTSFEGVMFPVPGNVERYLETMYGSDWRELPPLERRRNHAPVVLDFSDAVSQDA
ncbi:MAG: LicD family protein, partial [Gordonibacter sp.]|uniref:LicD family protein n=1 Tax=Gordonibacter sp. TaxID=1968902 RepID=UPI002FC7B7FD